MGFVDKNSSLNIPVSDTRAYKQLGNSVVVPVFEAVATILHPYIEEIQAIK
jgi:DNA (cytosine-5)-methyltransferase 1